MIYSLLPVRPPALAGRLTEPTGTGIARLRSRACPDRRPAHRWDVPARPPRLLSGGPTSVRDVVTIDAGANVLVPLAPDHLDGMWDAMLESSAELRTTMAWWRDEQTRDDMAGWIDYARTAWEGGSMFAFSIVDADGRYLGACSLEGVSRQASSANLSYWVRTGATGRGVARTAARALARWGCLDRRLRRVEISVVTSNTASIAVARGSGAHHEGCQRNKAAWAGNNYDLEVFSFIPDDFDSEAHIHE